MKNILILGKLRFQSPCGVKVCGKLEEKQAKLAELAFQSPCGVKVCGKMKILYCMRIISVVSIPLRGKGMRKVQIWGDLVFVISSFNPLAG